MTRDTKFLAALFTASGVLHFVKPRLFEKMVPRAMPRKKDLVFVSGAAEIVTAAMLLHPRTRRFGGIGAAGLLAAVFPANLQMTADALRSQRAPAYYKIGTILRLPLQGPMIRIALKAARS